MGRNVNWLTPSLFQITPQFPQSVTYSNLFQVILLITVLIKDISAVKRTEK